jgi:hypothetical protein
MAVSATNSYTGAGLAEDFQDIIYDISPEETPLLSMAKKSTAGQTYHQWQTDTLAAAATNAQIEGDDAAYGTLAATTVLGNYTQISRKTVQISNTYDVVKKYGRKSEVAYQLMKAGKELKRDMEFALVRNQASSAGGAGTARSSAGLESWISGNAIAGTGNTTTTTPGFAAGAVAAPTDGTAVTFIEADLKSALEAAWLDGGEPTTILMSSANKKLFSAFAGIAEKRHMVNGTSEAIITAAADVYVSDYGNHTVKLDRFMRDEAVLCVDPQYVGVASLRPITKEELAKTGDSTKYLMTAEYALVVNNPDAHAKVAGIGA